MQVISPDFSEGGNIPKHFTCDGQDISPTLKIEGVPQAAKSLVLIADDPDAPSGTFTHWLIWNLRPDVTEILATTPPAGAVQGVNDFGRNNYGGPCPPSGVHRYYFKLFALDTDPGAAGEVKAQGHRCRNAGSHYRRGDADGAVRQKRPLRDPKPALRTPGFEG